MFNKKPSQNNNNQCCLIDFDRMYRLYISFPYMRVYIYDLERLLDYTTYETERERERESSEKQIENFAVEPTVKTPLIVQDDSTDLIMKPHPKEKNTSHQECDRFDSTSLSTSS